MRRFIAWGLACMAAVLITCFPVSAAAVTNQIAYQGLLTDESGTPLSGTYSVTFTLYNAATGGTGLSTNTSTVQCTNGLFTASIPFNPSVFDGRALWLGTAVGGDAEMTPRQEIQPVPYALGLKPWVVGASFTTNKSGDDFLNPAVNISTTYSANTGIRINTTGHQSPGIYSETNSGDSPGISIKTKGFQSEGVSINTYGSSSPGVQSYANGDFSSGIFGWSDDSSGVFGYSVSDSGVSGNGRIGGFFTSSTAGTGPSALNAGVEVKTSAVAYNPGILVSTSGSSSDGIYSKTNNESSHGVSGEAFGNNSYAVYARAYGANGNGVTAWSSQANGVKSYGKSAGVDAWSNDGPGVWGQSTNADGVWGQSTNSYGVEGNGRIGGFFTSSTAGTGPSAPNAGVEVRTSAGTYNPGILVNTSGSSSDGIYSRTNNDASNAVSGEAFGDDSYAVYARAYGANGNGVTAWSSQADGVSGTGKMNGVRGWSTGGVGVTGGSTSGTGVAGLGKDGGYFTTHTGSTGVGIRVETSNPYNDGVFIDTSADNSIGTSIHTSASYSDGVNVHTDGYGSAALAGRAYGQYSQGAYVYSNQSHGIEADTNRADHMYGVYTPDYMYAARYEGGGGDVAEYMPVKGGAEPGTVLVIGEEGILVPSSAACDTRVAGIVSTAPGVTLGTGNGENASKAQIAVAGRVPCKVDATKGAIHAGDLLTTSDTPGHAMKADPITVNGVTFYPSGIVLGKAMGSLESGTGTIEVLVTLQ